MKELALHILDILQNSLRANASEIYLEIVESEISNEIVITISDNGKGIEEDMLLKVFDPFTTSRTSRRIGMGLAMLKYHAELCAGGINIESEKERGTVLKVWFQNDHFDRQPLGDIAGVFRIMMSTGENCEFYYNHQTDTGEFKISTPEIKSSLGLVQLSDNQLLEQIKELINENLKSIHSVLN